MLPEASIDASLTEIRSRYESDEDYYADLERIGLDALALRQAVSRDLVVEAVLEKVAAQSASVSETDVEIFWRMHRQRFRRAETRLLRHILVTINDDLTDNQRQAARSRIDAIRTRLRQGTAALCRTGAEAFGMPDRDQWRPARPGAARPALSRNSMPPPLPSTKRASPRSSRANSATT
jgi:hypothetical protein